MKTSIAAGLSWLAVVSYAQTAPFPSPASTVIDTLPVSQRTEAAQISPTET